VQGNICYDNDNTGIWVFNASYITIDRNFVYTSANVTPAHGIGIGMDQTGIADPQPIHHNTVTNNIVVGRRSGFIYACYVEPTAVQQGLVDSLIANNTFVHVNLNGKLDAGSWATACVVIENRGQISNTNFVNNIFLQDSTYAPMTYGQGHWLCTWNYNCWWTTTPGFAGANKVSANPALVDATASITAGEGDPSDYKLTAPSPCRDVGRGMAGIVDEDYWETARPQNVNWDIGAHEYS
jgi:parallel beta-helix repeat protein